MKKTFLQYIYVGILGAAWCCHAAWETNFKRGLELATEQDSAALVEFTGSDWCSACRVLHAKVLSTDTFADYLAANKLVFVELDYPQARDKVSPEERAERETVRERYEIKAYPTVLVVDGKGRPYGRLVGAIGSPKEYLARLDKALETKREFEDKWAAASALPPAERANGLDRLLKSLPPDSRPFFPELVDEIIANDPEDTLGYKKTRDGDSLQEAQLAMVLQTLNDKMNGKSPAEALPDTRAAALELLKRDDLLPFVRLSLNAFVSQGYVIENKPEEALKYMDAAIAAAPDTKEAEDMRTRGRGFLLQMISAAQEKGADEGAH